MNRAIGSKLVSAMGRVLRTSAINCYGSVRGPAFVGVIPVFVEMTSEAPVETEEPVVGATEGGTISDVLESELVTVELVAGVVMIPLLFVGPGLMGSGGALVEIKGAEGGTMGARGGMTGVPCGTTGAFGGITGAPGGMTGAPGGITGALGGGAGVWLVPREVNPAQIPMNTIVRVNVFTVST